MRVSATILLLSIASSSSKATFLPHRSLSRAASAPKCCQSSWVIRPSKRRTALLLLRGGGGWSASRAMLDEDSSKSTTDSSHSDAGDTHGSNNDSDGVGGDSSDEKESSPPPPEGFEVVCKDGVCSLQPVADQVSVSIPAGLVAAQPDTTAETPPNETETPSADIQTGPDESTTTSNEMFEDNEREEEVTDTSPELEEMVKMGWERDVAANALAVHGNDVAAAAEALAMEEEADLARFAPLLETIAEKGWDEDAGLLALRATNGNLSQAIEVLEAEDRAVNEQFSAAVEDMVQSGWDGDVARQALLTQWQKDAARSGKGGSNSKVLQELQQSNQKVVKKAGAAKKKKEPEIKPAARDTVVFEVTANNLQAVVMESPVPVLLDVYADWCGPCKQLGPILEDMAVRSGGMFRLAKLNSDKEKGLAELLKVEALPSVFAIRDGTIIDNFVGSLQQKDMQTFLMNLVTGSPPPPHSGDDKDRRLNPEQLIACSRRLQQAAGLAALGMARREKLSLKIDNVLAELVPEDPNAPKLELGDVPLTPVVPLTDEEIAEAAEKAAIEAAAVKSARVVSALCRNAAADLANQKYRRISQASAVYQKTLLQTPPALEILRLAGFREKEGDEGYLVLSHKNVAVLTLTRDRCDKWLKTRPQPPKQPDPEPEEEDESTPSAPKAPVTTVILYIETPGKEPVTLRDLSVNATLVSVFDMLGDDVTALSVRFPKVIFTKDEHGPMTLVELGLAPSARVTPLNAEEAEAAILAAKEETGEEAIARRKAKRQEMREARETAKRLAEEAAENARQAALEAQALAEKEGEAIEKGGAVLYAGKKHKKRSKKRKHRKSNKSDDSQEEEQEDLDSIDNKDVIHSEERDADSIDRNDLEQSESRHRSKNIDNDIELADVDKETVVVARRKKHKIVHEIEENDVVVIDKNGAQEKKSSPRRRRKKKHAELESPSEE